MLICTLLEVFATDQGGKADVAFVSAEEILAHLATGNLAGADAPFRVYLTCCRILQAHHDPRALAILRVAHERLQACAATIGDERLRRSFPEHVPAHRELVIEFKHLIIEPLHNTCQ